MKTIFSLLLIVVLSVSLSVSQPKSQTTKFNVSMSCGKCKAKIEKSIPFEKGVKDLSIDLSKKQVSVTYDPAKTSKEELVKAFEKLQFKASEVTEAKK